MTLVTLFVGFALMAYNLFDALTLRADAVGNPHEAPIQRLCYALGAFLGGYLMLGVIVLLQPGDVVLFVVSLLLLGVAGFVLLLLRFVRELLPVEA